MECPHIPFTSYGEFSKGMLEKVIGQHIPIEGSIELTARCNLDCGHCYINLPAADLRAREKELTTGEWHRIIDQVVDAGCLWLLITGGEPFIRPDFFDIYIYAKKKGLLITIFTNGTTITHGIADRLAEWLPYSVEITLYGYTQETYERVTGRPGSYARCMQGIDLLWQRKIPFRLKTMVLTLNRHELDEMRAFAEQMGAQFRYDPVLNMRLDGGKQPAELRLSLDDVLALELADQKRVEAWADICDRFGGPPLQPEFLYSCGAGINSFHIDPYGQLTGCLMVRHPAYDLCQGTFHDGWHNFMVKFRTQKRTRETRCQTCDLISLCGNCPGFARAETGDEEAVVDYLCEIAHLRASAVESIKSRKGENNGQASGNKDQQAALQ